MGPGERKIQHELRRQAAQVAVPTDMWENISGRLDGEPVQGQRQAIMLRAQWKPALALAAAVGMLWLNVPPSAGPGPEPEAVTEATPDVAGSGWGYDTFQVRFYRQAGYDMESVPPEARPTRVNDSDPRSWQSPRTMAIR